MSIRKVQNGSGTSRWEVRVYEDGRGSHYICKRFDKKSDAEAWLHEFETNKAEKARNPFSSISFEEKFFQDEAEGWLTDGRNRFSPGHMVKSKAIIQEFLDTYGNLAIERFTPEFLTKFQQAELRKGLQAATVNRKTEVCTAILNFAVKQRRIPFNPVTGFRKLVRSQKEMEFWSQEEARDFLSHVSDKYQQGSPDRWAYVAYMLALNTGLRAGEIWGLKVSDINDAQKTITVKRQFNRVSLDFAPTKSKKPRVVPCNQALLSELRHLIQTSRLSNQDTIFRNEKGKPVCHDNFTDRNFQKDLKSWGGKMIRFHDLRHTATTLLIASGVDIKTVKEICGHSDIATTMNYVHLVSGAIEKVAATFSIEPANRGVSRDLRIVK